MKNCEKRVKKKIKVGTKEKRMKKVKKVKKSEKMEKSAKK